jgi:disulfide oxidoreductase YuzD
MSKIKVFVHKARLTNWYHNLIGKTIEVYDEPKFVNNKLAYEYVDIPNHVVFEEDILRNEKIRDKKLIRINNN